MKEKLFFVWIFVCLSVIVTAKNKALIIAVGEYPSSSGWVNLASENDAILLKETLLGRGFKLNNIEILKNQQATYQGILNKFSSFTKSLNSGDIIYLQFSGHGQQVKDDNGDEIDGMDEAFVPYDSPLRYNADSYQGERLLRDDQIGDLIKKIRSRIGRNGQLIVVMDSCHSGTGLRGESTARGTNVMMAPDEYQANSVDNSYSLGDSKNTKELAPFIAFFASSADESNKEYLLADKGSNRSQKVGSLSFAIASTINDFCEPLNVQELFDRVKLKMAVIAPSQHPQVEGNTEIFLFNTKDTKSEVLYSITNTHSSKRIEVSFGLLSNIPKGSKVEAISLDKNKVISKGVVTKSALSFSEVKLEQGINIKKDGLVKIKVTEKALPKIYCSIHLDIEDTDKWDELIVKMQKRHDFQITTQEADLYLSDNANNDALELKTKEGDFLYQTKKDKSTFYNANLLLNKILAFNQCNFLRQYQVSSNELSMDMELIPIKVKEVNGKKVEVERLSLRQFRKQNNRLIFKEGDAVKIKVINQTNHKLYYSIIDIQPNNEINILIPELNSNYTGADFFLKAGESKVIDIPFIFKAPYGRDILKLIATKEPIDLSFIHKYKGATKGRGITLDHPFEKLFGYSFQTEDSRSENVRQVSPSEAGVSSLIFEIVKE